MQPDPQARLATLLQLAQTQALRPFLAGYLRLGLAPVRTPNPTRPSWPRPGASSAGPADARWRTGQET